MIKFQNSHYETPILNKIFEFLLMKSDLQL